MTDFKQSKLAPILPEDKGERSKVIKLLVKSLFRELSKKGFTTFDMVRFLRRLLQQLLASDWSVAKQSSIPKQTPSESKLISIVTLKGKVRKKAIKLSADRLMTRLKEHGFQTLDIFEFNNRLAVYVTRMFRRRMKRRWQMHQQRQASKSTD